MTTIKIKSYNKQEGTVTNKIVHAEQVIDRGSIVQLKELAAALLVEYKRIER